jgi:hypothetical protein
MTQRFPTKVDTWLAIVLALVATVAIVGTIFVAQRGGTDFYIGVGALGFFAAIILLLVWPMHYDLEPSELVVRFGVVRLRIPYERIDAVKPTRNPLSSPAMSLDRLEIRYRRSNGKQTWVLISPREKGRFLGELARISGIHRVDGERLVRADRV